MRAVRTTLALTLALGSSIAAAQAIPGLIATPVPGSYPEPVAVRAPNDGSGRIFIVQKSGTIRVKAPGPGAAVTFNTISVSASSESGLLGLAFHPNYGKPGLPHNDEYYVAYTRPSADPRLGSTPDQVIARFTGAEQGQGTIVMRVPDLASNHNGGDIHFGPDGYLYMSMGDGGPQGNPHGFAQCLWKKPADSNQNSCGTNPSGTQYFMLGKMLRIDVDNRGGAVTADMCGSSGISPAQYSIPPGNPHVATSNTCDEIFAHGFRNPWRFSFDRLTDDLIIGDVGQNTYEEITVQPAGTGGGDHGWSRCEGRHSYSAGVANCPATTSTIGPVIEYNHDSGRCAVTGGYVYRGPAPSLQGLYFFGDSCVNRLFYATASGATWDPIGLQDTTLSVSSPYGYGEDEAGNVYIAQVNGVVLKLQADLIFKNGFD